MTEERKKGAKSAARTELVAVRFDPEMKYMMEIAAKVQRRSVANYVEWAVEESLKKVVVYEDEKAAESKTANDLRRELWDPIESDRFCILASWFPNLISHDEQILWKLIRSVWTYIPQAQEVHAPTKGLRLSLPELELVRRHWDYLRQAARGEVPATVVVTHIQEIAARESNNG